MIKSGAGVGASQIRAENPRQLNADQHCGSTSKRYREDTIDLEMLNEQTGYSRAAQRT